MSAVGKLRRLGAAAIAAFGLAQVALAEEPLDAGPKVIPATLIEQRVLAQHGLSIALDTEILESQMTTFVGLLIYGNDGQCHALSGGGSIKVVSQHYNITTGAFGGRIKIFFTAVCTALYLDETVEFTTVGLSYHSAPTITVYSRAGIKVGTLVFTDTVTGGGGKIKVSGVGSFTPTNGGSILKIGLVCQIPLVNQSAPLLASREQRVHSIVQYLAQPRSSIITCNGAVAQNFPVIGKAVGATTPMTLTLTTTGANTSVTFTQTAASTIVTGALNALSVGISALGKPVVVGTQTIYGHDTFSGQAASLTLFPPKPTTWTVIDLGHNAKFKLTLLDNVTRKLGGAVTPMAGVPNLATIVVDQSGTGAITYSNATTRPISGWDVTN